MNSKLLMFITTTISLMHESLGMKNQDASTTDLQVTSDPLELHPFSTVTAYESTNSETESTIIASLSSEVNQSTDFPLNFTGIEEHPDRTRSNASKGWSWEPMVWPWWTVMQLVFAILGMVGNSLVILVVFRKNSSSRSTDILVGNLAVADFLSSIVMIPLPIAKTMPPSAVGRLYCIFCYSPTLKWMLITVSSYQLVTISFDRYFAVVHPLAFNRLVTKRRVFICTSLVWLIFMTSASRGIFIRDIEDTSGRCVLPNLSLESMITYASFIFCLRLVIPTFLILLTQLLIAKKLYREAQRFSKTLTEGTVSSKPSVHLTARTRVLKMMVIIVIVFFICWAPSQVAFFGKWVGFVSHDYSGSAFQRSFITLAFFNSCVNPFIYTARNPPFRAALKDIFVCSRARHDPIFEHKGDDYHVPY